MIAGFLGVLLIQDRGTRTDWFGAFARVAGLMASIHQAKLKCALNPWVRTFEKS